MHALYLDACTLLGCLHSTWMPAPYLDACTSCELVNASKQGACVLVNVFFIYLDVCTVLGHMSDPLKKYELHANENRSVVFFTTHSGL